ncbi:4-methyl-5(B-hydroxyethyl)-thiazole monophosphate biosynthesis protein [Schleiferilactobacillus perolens DSM 12744]|uniref:4-methyl-5(B-hydroxyethyl)-thiazole monophosphate biosynthesis protein n=2 Tax=Schleiferilactobacillus perolens TaxID=100468 RepID=A0A0R1N3T4_9LACO|nr:4-methyl-5(B-hydroxyethyl)-thiazole monophosphate biosynthesis protein [Schleiferilactobacillus perolens DSM 12744]
MMDDYADWEGAYLSRMLNTAPDWTVKTASTQKEIKSIGGLTTKVDYQINQIPRDCALLVLIGGNSWTIDNEWLKQLIISRLHNGQPVAAICGAVDYLARNGLLNDYQHTGNAQYLWQDDNQYQNPTGFIAQQAVQDRNLVTANGTAALDFTEAVLKMVAFKPDDQVHQDVDLYRIGYYQYCQKYGNPFP